MGKGILRLRAVRHPMIRLKSLAFALSSLFVAGFGATAAHAVDNTWDYAVRVSATVQTAPASITLTWPQDSNGTPSHYTVTVKPPPVTSWSSIATLSGGTTSWTTTRFTAGAIYEYRITKAVPGG